MKNSIISVMNETAKGLYDAGVMSDASIQEIQSIVFCQDSLASYAEYQESKLHITGEEVSEWLDTWGCENEKQPPTCHR